MSPLIKRFTIKIVIMLICCFYYNHTYSQQATDTTEFRNPENYNLAVSYYLNQIEADTLNEINYYQAACYYSLLNNRESALLYLKAAIIKGARGEDVITDTDFNLLKSDITKWNQIEVLLKEQYLNRNPGITKLDLGYELWMMWIEDQRYRTLKKNYKLAEKPTSDLALHDAHLIRLKEIIETSGWPKYSEVGIEGGDAVFFIFQHDFAANMENTLPLLITAAKAGEADLTKAAMMIDRYLAYTENVQLYGTQAIRKIKPGQDRNDVPLLLYPIADEENLINRRNAIGMGDFIENCNRLGVTYIPITDRAEYINIPIKKKWIKAGYLL